MTEVTTASLISVAALKAEAVAAATAGESKIVTFIKAHYSKLVAAVIGFAISHFGVFGAIWKIL
jgi:hypothetical protein